MSKPENLKCPDCQGEMVPRTSQYGKFWGCKSFPRCKGTRDSEGKSKEERRAEQLIANGEEYMDADKESNGVMTSFKKN